MLYVKCVLYMYVCLRELLLEVTSHSGTCMFAPSELLLGVSSRSGLCVHELLLGVS